MCRTGVVMEPSRSSKKWLQFLSLLESIPSQGKPWNSSHQKLKSVSSFPQSGLPLEIFLGQMKMHQKRVFPIRVLASRVQYGILTSLEWLSWPGPLQEDQLELTYRRRPDSKTGRLFQQRTLQSCQLPPPPPRSSPDAYGQQAAALEAEGPSQS